MRVLTLTACVALLAAADGSTALAQSCGKGMLWPYVRQPGDCLTDDEIRAGQRGVYSGPVNTNPDMSNVRVEQPAQSSGVTTSTAPPPAAGAPVAPGAPSAAQAVPAAPAPQGSATLFTGQATTAGPTLNGPGFTPPPQRTVNTAACKKGWLWPFVREPGDCLTETEKGNGQGGVYRPEQVVAVAAPAAGTQVASAGSVATGSGGSVAAPPVAAAPACRKGWLWPFVRRDGDCPTDAERGRR